MGIVFPKPPKLDSNKRDLDGLENAENRIVNGYKIVGTNGPVFKVFDGDRQLGDDFPNSGEAAAHAMMQCLYPNWILPDGKPT